MRGGLGLVLPWLQVVKAGHGFVELGSFAGCGMVVWGRGTLKVRWQREIVVQVP